LGDFWLVVFGGVFGCWVKNAKKQSACPDGGGWTACKRGEVPKKRPRKRVKGSKQIIASLEKKSYTQRKDPTLSFVHWKESTKGGKATVRKLSCHRISKKGKSVKGGGGLRNESR